MGGLARALPITFICGVVSAAAISGVPPFNGFVSKWLIYQGALELPNRWLAVLFLVVAVFGSALTLASFVKVIHSAFLAPAPVRLRSAIARTRENFFLAAPMVVLAAGCVVLGLWPQLMTDAVIAPAIADASTAGPGVQSAAGAVTTGTIGLWDPTAATGLIVIGIARAHDLVWTVAGGRKVRVVRPFFAGEVPIPVDHTPVAPHHHNAGSSDRYRMPGTFFYETIGRLPIIGGALKQADAGAMDPHHWSGRHGKSFVEMLRGFHTGLLNLYVAWVFLGVVVTLVYLLLCMGG
jgi:NADH:ubiquinone oxidoreductase subunit 5 (subunit L)/multisubunit Na+/H+ antiporter MnhA subunit